MGHVHMQQGDELGHASTLFILDKMQDKRHMPAKAGYGKKDSKTHVEEQLA